MSEINGTNGLSFLSLGWDARGLALGGNGRSSLAAFPSKPVQHDDKESSSGELISDEQPGRLRFEIDAMHKWLYGFGGLSQNYAQTRFSGPLGKSLDGAMGLRYSGLGYRKAEGRDNWNNPTKGWQSNQSSFGAIAGMAALDNRLSFGLQGKFLLDALTDPDINYNHSRTGWGLDLALAGNLPVSAKGNFSNGAEVSNIGQIGAGEEKDQLPLEISLQTGYQHSLGGLSFNPVLGLDYYRNEQLYRLHAGTELAYETGPMKLSGRAGYRRGSENSVYSFGFGVETSKKLTSNLGHIGIDYAVVSHPVLGLSHTLSLNLRDFKIFDQ